MKTTAIASAIILASAFAASASFAEVTQYGERATGISAPVAQSTLSRADVMAAYNQAKADGTLMLISNHGNQPFAQKGAQVSGLTRAEVMAQIEGDAPATRLHF